MFGKNDCEHVEHCIIACITAFIKHYITVTTYIALLWVININKSNMASISAVVCVLLGIAVTK